MTQTFWYGWKGVPDYSFSQRMTTVDRNRLVSDTRSAIEAVKGFKPYTNMALLMPIMSYSLADEGGCKGDMIDSGGLYHLLLDAGFTVDVWTPYEIEYTAGNPLEKYDALFLSDCPVLPRAVYEKLTAFVDAGGALISSGRLPEKDLRGMSFNEKLAGKEHVVSFEEPIGRHYWGKLKRAQVYGNTPPVLVEMPDPERTPELRSRLRQRVIDAVAQLAVSRSVAFAEDTGAVHVVPFRDESTGATLLFLVHKGEQVSSCRFYGLDATLPTTAAEAWCDYDSRHPCTPLEDNILRTPDFAHACIITLK